MRQPNHLTEKAAHLILHEQYPSKVRNCAEPPDNLRSEISFSSTDFKLDTCTYKSHCPFNAWNASLFVRPCGYAVACA